MDPDMTLGATDMQTLESVDKAKASEDTSKKRRRPDSASRAYCEDVDLPMDKMTLDDSPGPLPV